MSDQKNSPSPQGKSNPSDPGQKDKAAIKKGKTEEEIKKEKELKEKYLEENGEIPPHLEKGTNRNPDKPNIHKPPYGGGTK
ncbi:hypothetical protein KIH41_04405 [Litoribacter ruber]|uniref:hypothetical protein n=1 Tax=Litoribacter ruber TaxID=702568 RepID=UPI001BD95705|nr:hypothetical protein [Litoribacter ruber]MBT0810515.1 hypothetical protein [Litoribacter ruber]